jgi:hypothetical protein
MRNKIYEQKERAIGELESGSFNPKDWDIFESGAGKKVFIKTQYRTESVSGIRPPSHAWPWSEFKHAFTKKYQSQLLEKLKND